MTDVAELLERTVPEYRGAAADWDTVLRDAGVGRRRTRARLSLAVAVAAAAVALAVAWPFAGEPPSVVARALAATGDGEVFHLVFESDLPKTFVDLETGEQREVRGRYEVWLDPSGGMRQRETFEGVPQFDGAVAAAGVDDHAREIYTSLGQGYRDALRSGEAEVVGDGEVDGIPVHWIRIAADRDPAGPGEMTHEVAVSRKTYAPVYLRIVADGHRSGSRILEYETLDSAPLAAEPLREPDGLGFEGAAISVAEAERRLGRAPLWTGGGPATIRAFDLPKGDRQVTGVSVSGEGALITQAAEPADGLTMMVGLRGWTPPEDTLVMEGTSGLLRSHGLVVAIHAPGPQAIVAAARALRPCSAAAGC